MAPRVERARSRAVDRSVRRHGRRRRQHDTTERPERWICDGEPSDRYPIWTRGQRRRGVPLAGHPGDVEPRRDPVRRARLARRAGALRRLRRRRVLAGEHRDHRVLRRLLLPQRVGHPHPRCAHPGPHAGADGLLALGRDGGRARRTSRCRATTTHRRPTRSRPPSGGSSRRPSSPTSRPTSARWPSSAPAAPTSTTMSDAELVAWFRGHAPELRRLFAEHLYITYCSTVPLGVIQGVCTAIGDPTLAMTLVAGIGGVDSAAPSYAFWEMGRLVRASASLTAAFDAGVDGLLDRLRAADDADATAFLRRSTTSPTSSARAAPTSGRPARRRGRPTPSCRWPPSTACASPTTTRPRAATRRRWPRPRSGHPRGARRRRGRSRDARAAQRRAGRRAGVPRRAGAHEDQHHPPGERDARRRATRSASAWSSAATTRSPPADRCSATTSSTSSSPIPEPWVDTIKEREAQYELLFDLEPPFVFAGEVPPLRTWHERETEPTPVADGHDARGHPRSVPGQATGRARVVLDPSDPTALEPGDVLIAPITDPAWTPLFVPAAAVVVDVGAQLSHAVIVSRELGIPCVVSVTGGTRLHPRRRPDHRRRHRRHRHGPLVLVARLRRALGSQSVRPRPRSTLRRGRRSRITSRRGGSAERSASAPPARRLLGQGRLEVGEDGDGAGVDAGFGGEVEAHEVALDDEVEAAGPGRPRPRPRCRRCRARPRR